MNLNQSYVSASYGRRVPYKEIINDDDVLVSNNSWEDLDISKFAIKKPTIICLGGNGTLNSKSNNGVLKLIQYFLGIQTDPNTYCNKGTQNTQPLFPSLDDIDLIGVTYGYDLNNKGYLNNEDISKLIDSVFMPLITKDGVVFDQKTISKNFRNITFFNYCKGSEVCNELMEFLISRMSNLGISKKESKEMIYDNLIAINYAPLEASKYQQSFSMKSFNDYILSKHSDEFARHLASKYKKSSKEFKTLSENSFKYGEIIESGKNQYNYYINQISSQKSIDDHNISVLERQKFWQWSFNEGPGDYSSQLISVILGEYVANSIQNSQSDIYIKPPEMEEVVTSSRTIIDYQNSNSK